MALKKTYASQSDIPEALRSLYRQDGNRWGLDLDADDGDQDGDGGGDNADANRRLAEFRENNRKMARELESLRQREAELSKRVSAYGDTEPDQIQEVLQLLGKLKDHDDAALIKAGRIDEVIAKRVKTKETEWGKQLEAERKQREEAAKRAAALHERAGAMQLQQSLRKKIAEKKYRLLPSAEVDLLLRAGRTFRFGDDLDAEPESLSGDYASLDEFVTKLPEVAPHWFDGGAGGSAGGGAGAGGNKGGRGGIQTVKRSEIPHDKLADVLVDAAAGKIKIEG